MADTIDVDINVNTETGELDILAEKLSEVTSNEDVDVTVNVDDENLDGTQEKVDSLSNSDAEINVNVDDTAVDETEAKVEGLDGSTVNVNVNIDNSGVDETKESVDETTSSVSSLGLAVGGLAATAGFEQMAAKADSVNTSWNQLSLTFGGTSSSMDNLKASTEQAAQATGRAGSTVRGYFNDMGIAGVTNTNLLSQSFQALAGKSYQTGSSIESMEQKMKTMVMSGNAGSRQLTALGISSTDLARVMGVSADQVQEAFKNMTPEERLQAITKAMGDGKAANDMYKQSFAGMKEQMSIAIGGLMAAIGQGILPTVIPIVQGVTGAIKTLGGAFKSLPGPVQGIIGGFGGLVAVGATAIGTLGTMGKVGSGVVDGLRSMRDGYRTVKDAIGTARTALEAIRNAESITQGVRAALLVVTGAETTAEAANATAKASAIGPTTGLAIAENALLWPLLLIVGAIVAVVAVMWYLYNTNETVRNGINWLANAFQQAGQWLMNSFGAAVEWTQGALENLRIAIVNACNWIMGALQNLWNYITTAGGLIPEQANITGNKIVDAAIGVMVFFMTLPYQIGMIFFNLIAKAMGFGDNFCQRMIQAGLKAVVGMVRGLIALPGRVYAILLQVIAGITSWAANLVNRARTAATNFVNNLLNPIRALPGMIQSAVSGIADILFKPFQDAWNKIKPIVDSIKNAVSSVTGWLGDDEGGVGYYSDSEGVPSLNSNLNTTLSSMASNSTSNTSTRVNNNFYGLVEESAADYIIQTVNDRLRKEKIIKGV